MKLIKDLFYGPGNANADLGRLISFLATTAMLVGVWWNIHLGLPIELDKAGVGFAAVLGGCAAFVYAKDRAKAENTVAKAMETEAELAGPPPSSNKPKRR